jgi:hypothetical protein
MYMLLIIQLTPGCMSDQYVRVNDNSNETMMTMPDLMRITVYWKDIILTEDNILFGAST